MSKEEDKDLKDVVDESLEEVENEDFEDFDDYVDPDEEDDELDEDEDDEDEDNDDDEEDSSEVEPKGKGVNPLILGGLGLAFIGAVGVVGATQFGLIGGSSSSDQLIGGASQSDPLPMGEPSSVTETVSNTGSAEDDFFGEQQVSTSSIDKSESTATISQDDLLLLEEEKPAAKKEPVAQLNIPEAINYEDIADKVYSKVEEDLLKSPELEDLVSKGKLTAVEVNKIAEKVVKKKLEGFTVPETKEIDTSNLVSSTEFTQELESIRKQLEQVATEPRLSKKEVEKLLKDRVRLKGFVVINKTIDGEMTVVKTPMKRVNVYYAGERFMADGKWHTVKGIEDNGHIVLVGNKYFIDSVEEKPVVKKKPKVQAKPKKEVKAEKKEVVKAINPEQVESKQYRAELINGKKVAVGYSKNGEYGSGYLIKKPSGKWETFSKGDIIEGLGKVLGVDIDQNLIVGDFVILNDDG